MKKFRRQYCHHCSSELELKMEGETIRDYCPACGIFYYENPLPVVSAIVVRERQVLLVKRANEPHRGEWCLPSGFAECGESVAEAVLRELAEETGLRGEVIRLVDVASSPNSYYGDLLFLTFEVKEVGGQLAAADDAEEVRYFPVAETPPLAFPPNTKALARYAEEQQEYWAIVDSFAITADDDSLEAKKDNLLSTRLVALIEDHSEGIARLWVEDVMAHPTTPTFHAFDQQLLFQRVFLVLTHFGQWLSGSYHGQDIRSYYENLGRERKREGFAASEVISGLNLTKKHIWEFALSRGIWKRTIDMYMILELERRISLFFDRAAYSIVRGYENDLE